jgi:hypothetical protein
MNEKRSDTTLWVATLDGASTPFTAAYPVSWGSAVALLRSLWPGRAQDRATETPSQNELRGAVRP